jgi:hypothetical protein
MRIGCSVTSVSWIPQGATEGFHRLTFGLLRVAHYDRPPPDVLGDLDELQAVGRFRLANRLEAWIEVEDGRVVDAGQAGGGRINVTRVGYGPASIAFTPVAMPDLRPAPERGPTWVRFAQTAGGWTGFPTPRRVRHEPFVKLEGPMTWTTLALTIHADGTCEHQLAGASSFPRHWIYNDRGQLVAKTGFIDYDAWWRESFGAHTPLGCGGLGPDRDRGGVGAGASAVGWRDRRQAAVPAAPGRPDPGPARPARAGAVPALRRRASGGDRRQAGDPDRPGCDLGRDGATARRPPHGHAAGGDPVPGRSRPEGQHRPAGDGGNRQGPRGSARTISGVPGRLLRPAQVGGWV